MIDTNLGGFLDKSAQLRKRKLAKGFTIALVRDLVALKSPLRNSYKKSFWCCHSITQKGKTLTSMYCNQRWCYVCNRIRTARLIDGYESVLTELPELRFVTLTRPNVSAQNLRQEIRELIAVFRQVRDKLRKAKIHIRGVRKLEITYNEESKTYHPHFHVLMGGELEAQCLIREWLAVNQEAKEWCQDDKPADKDSLSEVFKYCTKISDNSPEVNDVIFQALRGLRMVQPMGVKKISEDVEDLVAEEIQELTEAEDVYVWQDEVNDWVSSEFGYLLCEELESMEKARSNVLELIFYDDNDKPK